MILPNLTKGYSMETTLMSSKGQVIIPKAIRTSLHWRPGTRFAVEETPAGVLLKPLNTFPTTDLESGLGCAGYDGPVKSIEEMREGIDEELARAWRKEGR
jgi:AbrB family looped-hinge helix DNA binding protein